VSERGEPGPAWPPAGSPGVVPPGPPGETGAGPATAAMGDPERGEATGGPAGGESAASPADALDESRLEALLFVAERPLSRREIATLGGAPSERVDALLGDLEVSLAGRGIRLVVSGDHVALATAPETAELVGRYVGGDPARLSAAMLETLAIVAYRQPVTRASIERIRGVDSEYVLRALLHRRLVVELGRTTAPGRPFLYGTGYQFLERFGLTSLDELPPLDADIAERLVAGALDDGERGGHGGVQPPDPGEARVGAASAAPPGRLADA
jgi:segregation and condensation protein B